MNRIQRLILGLVLAVIASMGAVTAAPTPAHATDAYSTNFSERCGYDLLWGSFCQLTFTKSLSNQMKNRLVAGETVTAVASFACGKIPNWGIAIACVASLTYQAAKTRDAVNAAYGNSQKCVAYRQYFSGIGQLAPKVSAVTCNFGFQCCDGGSGGGGGGGGGGSWRETYHPYLRHATLGTKMVVAGSGGGSW